MKTLNIINTADIEAYLHRFCEGDERLQVFLVAALANIIKKNPECMETVFALPDNAPQWLCKKWDEQRSWHRFNEKKNIRLAGGVYDAVNWISSAIEHEMDWIENVDAQGRPRKLLQISSMEKLTQVISKDERRIAEKIRLTAKQGLLSGKLSAGFEKIMTFDDGYYIVRLKSEDALDVEGAYLEHCIGDGSYDYCLGGNVVEFYSLRNKENLPCVSMCVDTETYKKLSQVSGRRNSYPKNKFIPYIATFCSQVAIVMSEALSFDDGYNLLQE
jgi:hypothetical protein